MLVVFSPIFVADTKVTFVYNFVAPLMISFIQTALICLVNENLDSIFTPSSFFSSGTLLLSISFLVVVLWYFQLEIL